MNFPPETLTYVHKVLAALSTVNSFAKAITNSPLTTEVSAVVPGIAQAVAIIKSIEIGADAVAVAEPMLEKIAPILVALNAIVAMTPEQTRELLQSRIDDQNKTGG